MVSTGIGRTPGDSEVVFTVDHVQAAYDALTATGGRISSKASSGLWRFMAAIFHDPDGHVMSLFGPK